MAEKTININLRVDQKIAEKLRQRAGKLGLTNSAYIRMLILKEK